MRTARGAPLVCDGLATSLHSAEPSVPLSDLDDLDGGQLVIIGALSHERNVVSDRRRSDPAVIDRHFPARRTKPGYQQCPRIGDCLIYPARITGRLGSRDPASWV